MTFLYDYISKILFNNGIGPDNTGVYYKEDEATNTISSLDNVFSSFTFSDADTIFVATNTGDPVGAGTEADPVKYISNAVVRLTADHYQICLMESGVYFGEPFDFEPTSGSWSVSTARLFTKAGIDAVIEIAGGAPTSAFMRVVAASIGTVTNIEVLNVYFTKNGVNAFYEIIDASYTLSIKTYHVRGVENENLTGPYGTNENFIRANGGKFYFNNCYLYPDEDGIDPEMFEKITNVPKIYTIKNCIFKNIQITSSASELTAGGSLIENVFTGGTIDFNSITQEVSKTIMVGFTLVGDTNITLTYNCDNNKLWPGIGNIKDNPSFIVASPVKPIDFQIKTVKAGYQLDSPCFLTGNALGTENIGAYQGDPAIAISYRKYKLNILPDDFKPEKRHIKHTLETDLDKRTYPQSLGLRRPIGIGYRELSLVDSRDASVLDYISTHPVYNLTDPFGKIYNEIIIKLFENIGQGHGSGDIISYDGTQKKIIVDGDYEHDEFIDYNIWLIWEEQLGASLTENIISGLSGMIPDEHVGRWVYINNNIYQVIFNTETTLTVADFYNNLIDGTYDIFVFNSFQIQRQVENEIYVYDLKNVLVSVPTKYMINGLDVVTVAPEMTYNILGYNPDKDLIKWNRLWSFITTIEK